MSERCDGCASVAFKNDVESLSLGAFAASATVVQFALYLSVDVLGVVGPVAADMLMDAVMSGQQAEAIRIPGSFSPANPEELGPYLDGLSPYPPMSRP